MAYVLQKLIPLMRGESTHTYLWLQGQIFRMYLGIVLV